MPRTLHVHSNKLCIIFTTRFPNLPCSVNGSEIEVIFVNVLERKESLKLVLKCSKIESTDLASKIARIVGDLPLGIQLISRHLKKTSKSKESFYPQMHVERLEAGLYQSFHMEALNAYFNNWITNCNYKPDTETVKILACLILLAPEVQNYVEVFKRLGFSDNIDSVLQPLHDFGIISILKHENTLRIHRFVNEAVISCTTASLLKEAMWNVGRCLLDLPRYNAFHVLEKWLNEDAVPNPEMTQLANEMARIPLILKGINNISDALVQEHLVRLYERRREQNDDIIALLGNVKTDLIPRSFRENGLRFQDWAPEFIGSGAFGTVYKANPPEDIRLAMQAHDFALKVILRDKFKDIREARILSYIRHENIVTVYGYWFEQLEFETAESYGLNTVRNAIHVVLLMERCDGNLLRWMNNPTSGEDRNRHAKTVFQQSMRGVNYLHSGNPHVIHRDIKPENVLFIKCPDLIVKIGDFGTSKWNTNVTNYQSSGHTKNVGTWGYQAPEQKDAKYGRKVDVYAMGILMLQFLESCNEMDVYDLNQTILDARNERISEFVKDRFPKLAEIVQQMVKRDPAERLYSDQVLCRLDDDAVH